MVRWTCRTFLDDCYILITFSKTCNSKGEPLQWHANTNLADAKDMCVTCGHILRSFKSVQKQNNAVEEVRKILNINNEK